MSEYDIINLPEPTVEEEETQVYIPLKEHKYKIVSMMAYLLGINEKQFAEDRIFKREIYDQLNINKNARIIRNLCRLRTSIERTYKYINNAIKNGRQEVLLMFEYIPEDAVMALSQDGVRIPSKRGEYPANTVVEINKLISDRINNCKSLFPIWLNWDYVRELFIMPNGTTVKGTSEAVQVYYSNLSNYPFRVYLNMPPEDNGNILLNDRKFVQLLYNWHGDEFTDVSKVMDVSAHVKSNIYDFIDGAGKVSMIVDCENSDVYNTISMLRSLEWDGHLDKIQEIILVDDVHTTFSWKELEKYTDIPIEYILTERLKNEKSLVDHTLIAKVYEEFYESGIDSFILLSSDSDYWGLIKMLKKARFLVMVEHSKCGPDLKQALEDNLIFYCYLDDFYSGEESDQMKRDILLRYLGSQLKSRDFNLSDIMDQALYDMRFDMPAAEKKQFFAKYIKTLQLQVADDGMVTLRLKEK